MQNPLRAAALIMLCVGQLVVACGAGAQNFLFTWAIGADDGSGPRESGLAVTNDVRTLAELLSTPSLEAIFPGEDFSAPEQVAIGAVLNLRGVPLLVTFAPGSTELVISAPFLAVAISFDEGDRDDSLNEFEDWITGEADASAIQEAALTALFQELVANSAVDPIAGNPNSLQTRMFEAAFFTGTSGVYRPRPDTPEAEEWTGKDHFRMEGRYDRFSAGPWTGNVWEISLDHQLNLRNPKFALLFDLPFVVSQTEGSESFLVSVGLGFQWRPTHWWNLTPSVRVGGAGSFKLGAVALMANVNLTSSMRWEIPASEFKIGSLDLGTPDFELNLGNMFGWNGTFDDFEISDIRIAYELDNYAIRNGIDLTKRLGGRFLGGTPVVKLYLTDTWILGSRLFLDHYNELGLQLGTQAQTGGKWRDKAALNVGWVGGDDYNALQLKASYRF